jgi:hypothetical protein
MCPDALSNIGELPLNVHLHQILCTLSIEGQSTSHTVPDALKIGQLAQEMVIDRNALKGLSAGVQLVQLRIHIHHPAAMAKGTLHLMLVPSEDEIVIDGWNNHPLMRTGINSSHTFLRPCLPLAVEA